MTDPILLRLTPELRAYLLLAIAAGRRELRRNGYPAPREFDALVAVLVTATDSSGPQRPTAAPPDDDVDGALMNYARAARRLGVSERTVRRLVALGQLPTVRIGRRVLIHPVDVELIEGERRAG